ncbi:hypothetical protein K439DRAFT_1617728 [Ramaria rubella]|nr:hypothetical protein K439DRAFT_1617728 [Ramaria rubella]
MLTIDYHRLPWLAQQRARTEHLHFFREDRDVDVDVLMTAVEQVKENEAKIAADKSETLMQPPPPADTSAEIPIVPAGGVNGYTKQNVGLVGTLTVSFEWRHPCWSG